MPQSVLITGASGGIGRACALAFGDAGYSVAIHYHNNKTAAEELKAILHGRGQDAAVFPADLSDPEQVRGLFTAFSGFSSHLDAMVLCAGIAAQQLTCDVSDEQWRRMLDTDLSSVFYCCREGLKLMLPRKSGRIVTVSSIWGLTGGAMEAAYSAAKAGIIGLTKALAKEVAPSGITVNCVAPGVIDTAMCAGFSAEERRVLQESTPLGRLGLPQDVAKAVSFLASPDAGFITGQILSVDGGFAL